MKKLLTYLFARDKNPKRGLLAVEWVVLGYLLLTLLLMLFMFTKVHNPESMIWGRFRVALQTDTFLQNRWTDGTAVVVVSRHL